MSPLRGRQSRHLRSCAARSSLRHVWAGSFAKLGRTAHCTGRCEVDDASMSNGDLHRIEDELGERWLEEWAGEGVIAIEAYLAKHLAFETFLDNDRPA